jgi:hypothetical protein
LEIRTARREDAAEMWPYVRQTGKGETLTLELMELSIIRSNQAWTVLIDGRPVATYGIVDRHATEPAFLWLYTTTSVPKVTMIREARRFMRWAVARFGPVVALGDRWLKTLGFEPDGDERWVRWH